MNFWEPIAPGYATLLKAFSLLINNPQDFSASYMLADNFQSQAHLNFLRKELCRLRTS